MSKAAEPKEAGKKKKPLPLIIGAVLVVIALLVGPKVLGGSKKEETKKSKKKKHNPEMVHTLPLEEFLVNLNGGGDHYLKATIALEIPKELTEEKFKEHAPAVRDTILSTLGEKTIKQLSNPKGREGLKTEIMEKVNKTLDDEVVSKVFFTAFATQ